MSFPYTEEMMESVKKVEANGAGVAPTTQFRDP